MTEESLAPCQLLLEVFEPVSIYDPEAEAELAWEVSTDPDHLFPYLLAPRNYAEQEIDPIRCTASIGTVEVGVIDVPTVDGDQRSGWMTARVHDMLGRRCRLRRFIDDVTGWVTIADGPAGPPKMDSSYSAYRWTIRDTRETERKMNAFAIGGVTSIVPKGSIYGFGAYTDDDGDHVLLPSTLDTPVVGEFQLSSAGDLVLGVVNFAAHYTPGEGSDPPSIDDPNMVIDEAGQQAIEISELLANVWGARNADVLWRIVGDTDWNVARPTTPTSFRQPFVGRSDVLVDDEVLQAINYVTLFVADDVPDGFPTASGDQVEVIVRFRGPASEDYPFYVEGTLGQVLKDLYDGVFSLAPTADLNGFLYDPAELDAMTEEFVARIQYDPDALAAMEERVCLRQTSAIPDARAWTEEKLYAPSGWMPTLDADLRIAPVSRAQPTTVDSSLVLEDAVVVPSPNWGTGERTVSEISYTYPRYFLPDLDSGIEVMADGLAQRDVEVRFQDAESRIRYGDALEEYDASAFAAIGDEEGLNIPGQLETGNMLAQAANFDVLQRYRSGVQSFPVSVRRSRIPFVKVGDWVPWELGWLPDRDSGLRGSVATAAQIVSMRDDDCVWRLLVLEEGSTSAGNPGIVTLLEKVDDEPGSGEGSLRVLSDEES